MPTGAIGTAGALARATLVANDDGDCKVFRRSAAVAGMRCDTAPCVSLFVPWCLKYVAVFGRRRSEESGHSVSSQVGPNRHNVMFRNDDGTATAARMTLCNGSGW